MSINIFLKRLAKLCPSQTELYKIYKSDELYHLLKDEYYPKPKKESGYVDNISEGNNIIAELLDNYKVKMNFSDYFFYEDLLKFENITIFACSSYSYLTFTEYDKEIIEYDHEIMQEGVKDFLIINKCAKNPNSFMELLLHIYELHTLRILEKVHPDDNQVNTTFLDKCIKSAGGNMYANFCEAII